MNEMNLDSAKDGARFNRISNDFGQPPVKKTGTGTCEEPRRCHVLGNAA